MLFKKVLQIVLFSISLSLASYASADPVTNIAVSTIPSDSSNDKINLVRPKIMVIPYTKEGEDLRTILESNILLRIAVTKVKEGFDQRGFTTVDFIGKLKAAKDNGVFTSENQSDIKAQIIAMSGCDVYVVVEISNQTDPSGNSASVILTSYEVSTGNSLSNKVGDSGKFYTNDYEKLVQKAVENCIDDFLTVMTSKFSEILKNGRSVIVEISFAQDANSTMSSEFGKEKLPLSDLIEEWFEKNSYKNNYHIQGTTDLKMILDDVRIPLKDPETGNNYNSNKFALAFFRYLRELGLSPAKDIKGNTIYITVK